MSADTCQPSNQSTGTLIVTGADGRGRLLQNAPRRAPPSRASPTGGCPADSISGIWGPRWSGGSHSHGGI
jgi:hypothetical protein